MKFIAVLVIMSLVFEGCSQKPQITITKDYIKNDYWKKAFTNYFEVEKMKIKRDSILNIFQQGFNLNITNHWNITRKLESDSSFMYHYVSHDQKTIKEDTIYFDKSNKGNWFKQIPFTALREKSDTLGVLENNSWYRFTGLTASRLYVYIYVDSIGNVHRFDQDLSNY